MQRLSGNGAAEPGASLLLVRVPPSVRSVLRISLAPAKPVAGTRCIGLVSHSLLRALQVGFWLVWALHLGLLFALPRATVALRRGGRGRRPAAGRGGTPAGDDSYPRSQQPDGTAVGDGAGQSRGRLSAALHGLWDAQVAIAGVDDLWYAAALGSAYSGLGPWFLGSFQVDGPIGAFAAYGVLFRASQGADGLAGYPGVTRWGPRLLRFDCPDTYFMAVVMYGSLLVPVTLWVMWVVAGWVRGGAGSRGKGQRPPFFTWRQFLGVAPLGWMYFKVAHRLQVSYGAAAVLVSPVIGWLPLLVGGWLVAARRHLVPVAGREHAS